MQVSTPLMIKSQRSPSMLLIIMLATLIGLVDLTDVKRGALRGRPITIMLEGIVLVYLRQIPQGGISLLQI